LERALLSTNREIRNRAEAEIATHYRTDAHGGRTEFTRQISGRMGALAMVASAVAPWLFSTSEDATTTIPASWNGKLRN
ncbi:MAG: hypothetical protein K2Z81_25705, partial [Cyanobacteria bacterium]|nr:hypothetical protein [Cyanobacteriota bacterium]